MMALRRIFHFLINKFPTDNKLNVPINFFPTNFNFDLNVQKRYSAKCKTHLRVDLLIRPGPLACPPPPKRMPIKRVPPLKLKEIQ